jgi:hypothetical protein
MAAKAALPEPTCLACPAADAEQPDDELVADDDELVLDDELVEELDWALPSSHGVAPATE